MSPALIGLAAGAVLGLVNFFVLWWLAGVIEEQGEDAGSRRSR